MTINETKYTAYTLFKINVFQSNNGNKIKLLNKCVVHWVFVLEKWNDIYWNCSKWTNEYVHKSAIKCKCLFLSWKNEHILS